MYARLYDRLVLTTTTPEYSQAVNMNGFNAALVEVVTTVYGASASIGIQMQMSNDLENWVDVVSSPSMESPGYFTLQTSEGLGCRFVRLKYAVTGIDGDTAVLSAGIETADL